MSKKKSGQEPPVQQGFFARKRQAHEAFLQDVADTVRAVQARDPAARNTAEILLLYSGVHAVIAHRKAHSLLENGHPFLARLVSQTARHITGIEIHPGARIGKGLLIDHGMGVVIGETAEIGDDCTIYQGVTLGGTGKDVGKRHPTLGDRVMVGAGAKILGPVHIGSDSKVAANAVVLHEVPDACTAVGIPARVVRRGGVRVQNDLDQIHIPDPVAQGLCRMQAEIDSLKRQVEKQTEKAED